VLQAFCTALKKECIAAPSHQGERIFNSTSRAARTVTSLGVEGEGVHHSQGGLCGLHKAKS